MAFTDVTPDQVHAAAVSMFGHKVKTNSGPGSWKSPCPLCGGTNRCYFGPGDSQPLLLQCNQCNASLPELLDAFRLWDGDGQPSSYPAAAPRPVPPDPWRDVLAYDTRRLWVAHPKVAKAAEFYPFQAIGGEVVAGELKWTPRLGDTKKPRATVRMTDAGLLYGIAPGVYELRDREVPMVRSTWFKAKAAEPVDGVTYRRFERLELPLYRAHIARNETGMVYLCAGPKDAEAGALAGFSTVSKPNGEGRSLRRRWLDQLKRWGRPVRVVYDGDDAGRKGAARDVKALQDAGVMADACDLGDGLDLYDLIVATAELTAIAEKHNLEYCEGHTLLDLIDQRLTGRVGHPSSVYGKADLQHAPLDAATLGRLNDLVATRRRAAATS